MQTASILFTLLAVAALGGCSAGHEKNKTVMLALPPEFRSQKYVLKGRFVDVPQEIRLATESLCSPCQFAEPDERWSATDVGDGVSPPSRRFLSAGNSGTLWFVRYEHGGIGVHEHMMVFDSISSRPVYLGGGSGFHDEPPTKFDDCKPKQEHCEW